MNLKQKCKIYILAPLKHFIQIEMIDININENDHCDDYEKVDFISATDGWTFENEFIPNRKMDQLPMCKQNGNRFIQSAQNIAQIEFYIPQNDKFNYHSKISPGFAFTVRFFFEPNRM